MAKQDATLLIVDDEINNIRLLQGDLEDAGYEKFYIARDGAEAMEILKERQTEIDAVLLDRMMPVMDGMQVLEEMKQHKNLRYIPVIMQTAAASKEQMLEGIAAGVYYYLTKPYDEETMVAIVAAALRDYKSFQTQRADIDNFTPKMNLIRDCNFRLRTLDDASYLSTFLASLSPNPERTMMGLSELFLNAIEHGNLGITYREKSELLHDEIWHQEVERRLALPENKTKTANVYYARNDNEIIFKVKDEGQGFKWEKYLEFDPERVTHSHGRGIAMARTVSFDELAYIGNGNEVHCKIRLNKS